jgi:hypothetical protein
VRGALNYTRDAAVETAIPYYQQLLRALTHTPTSKVALLLRLLAPLLLLVALACAGAALYVGASASETYGLSSVLVDYTSSTNRFKAHARTSYQIWSVRVDHENLRLEVFSLLSTPPQTAALLAALGAQNPTLSLPDPTDVPLGAVVVVRNACIRHSGGPPLGVNVEIPVPGASVPAVETVVYRDSRTYVAARLDALQAPRWYNSGVPPGVA